MHRSDDRESVLRLGIVDRVTADDADARLVSLLAAAGQDLGQHVHRQLVSRKADDVHREERPPAHRVDVAERVGGGDPAEGARLIHDRGEKVHRRDQRRFVVQLIDARVVGKLRSDQDVWIGHHGQMAQDLRQVGRAELTRSAGPVAEAGQPQWLRVSGHRRASYFRQNSERRN